MCHFALHYIFEPFLRSIYRCQIQSMFLIEIAFALEFFLLLQFPMLQFRLSLGAKAQSWLDIQHSFCFGDFLDHVVHACLRYTEFVRVSVAQ